jgi:transposase
MDIPEYSERRLVLHADNAKPHTLRNYRTFCAENGLRLATHPPYSLDLSPSDFFLFGHVKNRLQGIVSQSQDELLAGIREVLDEITVETLERAFEYWMEIRMSFSEK